MATRTSRLLFFCLLCQTTTAVLNADDNVGLIKELKREIASLNEKLDAQQQLLENLSTKFQTQQCQLEEDAVREILTKLRAELTPVTKLPKNCVDIYDEGSRADAVYPIVVGEDIHPVFCEMSTDPGGWLVFQRRSNESLSFVRTWQEYKEGFGDLNGDFWLGNELLYEITQSGDYTLRIDLEDFDGNKAYAEYDSFTIRSEREKYQMNIGRYSGDAGDSFRVSKKCPSNEGLLFSTLDKYLDDLHSHCFLYFQGGWWVNDCACANLNGVYQNGGHEFIGIVWYSWGKIAPMKKTEMKIRLR